LLDACEESGGPQALRFWESRDYFVVVGYANRISREAALDACSRENVPVLRRCSGGGTVLQGPGCLNYSLVLRFDETGPLRGIGETNTYIMGRHRDALRQALGLPVEVRGITDLAIDGCKFSGNAQRRKRRALLFHGTFLFNFDLDRIGRLLNMPSLEPDYRQARSHRAFVRNLNVPASVIKTALQNAWNASTVLASPPSFQELLRTKYSRTEWNGKF